MSLAASFAIGLAIAYFWLGAAIFVARVIHGDRAGAAFAMAITWPALLTKGSE